MSELIDKDKLENFERAFSNGSGGTIRVLGSGGDYEDWPCPECKPKEHRRTEVLLDGGYGDYCE